MAKRGQKPLNPEGGAAGFVKVYAPDVEIDTVKAAAGKRGVSAWTRGLWLRELDRACPESAGAGAPPYDPRAIVTGALMDRIRTEGDRVLAEGVDGEVYRASEMITMLQEEHPGALRWLQSLVGATISLMQRPRGTREQATRGGAREER